MMEGLRRRDPAALAELLETHGRELHGVAFLILRDRASAEDVTVETLLTALDRARSIRDDGALRSWLLRVATNKALTLRRRSARIVQLHVVADARSQDPAGRTEERVALMDALDDLPPQTRAAVVLRYFADLAVPEIARALGKSENTIKSQLRVALGRLRASLEEDGSAGLREARHA